MQHSGVTRKHRLDFCGSLVDGGGQFGGFPPVGCGATREQHCYRQDAWKCQSGECRFHRELDGKDARMLSPPNLESSGTRGQLA